MHTDTLTDDEGAEWLIHHSAYPDTGEIIISKVKRVDEGVSLNVGEEFHLPIEIFIEFIGRKLMSDHISKIEQMSGKQVLEMLQDA